MFGGRGSRSDSPDQLLADILPHPLSILQRLFPPIELGKLDWACLRSADGEWLASAVLDDALLTISLSAHGRPTRFLTSVTADRGSLKIDHFHDFVVGLPGQVSRSRKTAAPFVRSGLEFGTAAANLLGRAARREFAYPGLKSLVGDFYRAVREPGSTPPITAEQSIDVAAARDTVIRLAERG